MATNIQCESILAGIQKLEEYLQDKIVRESLELDRNAETSKYSDLLSRLKLILTQYTEREKNLVYVGFMGHFSTGKSSTINSLLNLEKDSKNSRRVALNPVDQSITLITHDKNRDSLLNITKESLVSIRSSFIESDFLENVVIADTPGTGDPILVHAIAQDFLPMCDLIVYFFSSTSALGSADISLLKEKSSELPFIPIKFVITRADEFRKDRTMAVSQNNFDSVKAQDFLDDLGQRVRSLFKDSVDINPESFMLIDNADNYNLDLIRETIVDFANQSNVSAQLNIHSHKIMYFRLSAEKLQDFFCMFLQNKLIFLSGILSGADLNINRFRGKIQVANNNLTQSWNEKYREINDVRSSLIAEKIFLEFNLPDLLDLINSRQKKPFEFELQRSGLEKQNELKEAIGLGLTSQIRKLTSDSRNTIDTLSSLEDIGGLKSLLLEFKSISKDKLIENIDLLPSSFLISDSSAAVRDLDEKLVDHYNDLNKNLESLLKMVLNQTPLREFKDIIDDAVNALGRDFDNYFDAIAVYRTGIFSLGAKDSISKLGLGSQMDYLESNELTESRKLTIKQESQECLFPNNREILSNSFKKLNALTARIDELQLKIKKLSANRYLIIADIPASEIYKDSSVSSTKKSLFNSIDTALKEMQEILNAKISDLITKFSEEWKLDVEEMRIERGRRIRAFIVSTCIASTILCMIYFHLSKIDFANNWATVVTSSLFVNLISVPIASWLEKMVTNFPKNIKKREKEILDRLRTEYSSTINESIINIKSVIHLDEKIISDLWANILVSEPRKNWLAQRQGFHKELGLCLDDYNKLCREYSEIAKMSAEVSSEYFSDTKENLQKLDSFSENLQSESIQPSFSLLESTKTNLESVIQKIRAIEFV